MRVPRRLGEVDTTRTGFLLSRSHPSSLRKLAARVCSSRAAPSDTHEAFARLFPTFIPRACVHVRPLHFMAVPCVKARRAAIPL